MEVINTFVSRKWLLLIRKNKNLTQQQVACMANIKRTHYTQIETGSRNPSVKVAKCIADVLEFDWTLFFKNESNNTTSRLIQVPDKSHADVIPV
ncbi:MAG: helix-turn-helix transcriptional regulator [Parabacteroides sp.]|nr:helix-turn-helix transcriptional regulator [Parabacteroides sp.]